MRIQQNNYQLLSPTDAAAFVVVAEENVRAMSLPEPLCYEVFDDVKRAIDRRSQTGFEIDPTSRGEVTGLVCAIMRGQDHMRSVRVELSRYVVGLLQTDEATIQVTRDSFSKNLDDKGDI